MPRTKPQPPQVNIGRLLRSLGRVRPAAPTAPPVEIPDLFKGHPHIEARYRQAARRSAGG